MLIFKASDQHLVEHHLVEIREFQLFIIIIFDQMLIFSSFFNIWSKNIWSYNIWSNNIWSNNIWSKLMTPIFKASGPLGPEARLRREFPRLKRGLGG